MEASKDTLNIKKWARQQFDENVKSVRIYVTNGIKVELAVKMVNESSTLGSCYKAQLRKEFSLI